MNRYACTFILGALLLLLAGCGSSPSSRYPNFSAYKPGMTSGSVLADCLIIDDTMGDTNKIDVVTNRSIGSLILTHVTDRMIEKGYHIENDILTSVGLLLDPRRVYKIVESVAAKDADIDDLPIGLPPFYLNDIFHDESNARNLWSTYEALVHAPSEAQEGMPVVIPAAPAVGKQLEANTLIIVFLGGFSTSPSKRLNEESSSDASTVGSIAVQHISQVTVALYIVDAATGELLWSDQRVAQGGTIHQEKILRLADKILDDLP